MFKPTKLLKVVSVILIIVSVLGVISLGLGMVSLNALKSMDGVDQSLIDATEAAYSPLMLTVSVVSIVLAFVAAVLGLRGRSYKVALICMIAYIVLDIVSVIQTAMITGMGTTTIVSTFIGLLLPVLYLWGLYQSKED
ncbi:small-conductance mechanosensitive channel [Aequitasia blattaphilus]|uniref:DUF4064 domain-containing protein n=1 Tax=Aequitasia blattaphilus TaxID=2949332 RepID=A0ABT1E9D7_9FIRM|nr:hypothetical protein [Aequitasia blattaphilus]MCP1102454.1 hypothetical protein [Aequitasia blattaphilus]MCR8615094.1 hypothetical protein [Aequitasia blattaphilus]